MNRKDLLIFFGIEVFAIIWAGTLFTFLPSKLLAGALAGAYFIFSGLYMLAKANHWPAKWKSITWYVLFVHVFVISIPMVLTRFVHMTMDFGDVTILGMPGPVFHGVSSGVFFLLMLGTVTDWLRAKYMVKTS